MAAAVFEMPLQVPESAPREIVIDYEAQPKQVIFHSSDADETVFGGAKGGGKSCALVMDAVAYALKFPGAKVYLFRKTYDELEANLIDELFKRVPQITPDTPHGLFLYDATRHIARFRNGSRIFFRYVRNLKDARKYAGREMDYLGIDELTQHEEEVVQILLSCMRSPKGYPTRFKATCNPGDIGHVWVKKRYITPTMYGQYSYIDEATGNKIRFIPARVYDNYALLKMDPRYVKRLENLPPTLRKAFLEGNWDLFENQMFEEWDPSIHVCKPFDIPAHWRRWRSADNGYTDPFAFYWLTVSPDGTVYIYREYTRNYGDPKVTYTDQARKVVQLSKYREIKADGQVIWHREKIDFTIVGHDAFSVDPMTRTPKTPQGKAIVDYYRAGGLKDCVKAITDRRMRAAVWHEYLKPYWDENLKKWRSKVVIFNTCKYLIETLPQQIVDEKDPEKYSDQVDYDHWVDAAGYGLLSFHVNKSKTPKEAKTAIQRHKEGLAKKRHLKRLS